MKKKTLITSLLTIAMCLALIAGSTYALFTSEDQVNIAVTSGKVNVTATINNLKGFSMNEELTAADDGKITFANGGTVVFASVNSVKTLTLDRVTPGDKVTFTIDLTNTSNIDIFYRLAWNVTGSLKDELVIEADGTSTADWVEWKTPADSEKGEEKSIEVSIELPVEATTQGLSDAAISFTVEAVQANGKDLYGKTVVEDAEDLVEALKNGGSIILIDDVNTEAATTAPYGNKYGVKMDGGILDGNGKELDIECYGDDYGIMISAGTVKNLTIDNGTRAIMIMYPQGDIILDNVNIGGDGVLYPINTGEAGAEGVNLIVTNSTLAGWTSYSNIESASFTNVKFEQGTYYNNIYGRVLKPYVNTTLTNCSFIEHMNLDLSGLVKGQKVVMDNCTVNGQAINNYDVFTIPSTDEQYDTELLTVDLPSWATSIEDCIVFPSKVSSFEQLTDAIENGGTVVLTDDIAISESIALNNADFVLDGNGHTITMADDAVNTYALFDITGGRATIKNVTFDGIKEGAIVRTVGVEFYADNVTAINGEHTQQQGLFRLMGKSTITNCTFKNNTCNMVMSLNYDGGNNDPQLVQNCVFENNTCNATAVLYYVKGESCTLDGNKFIGNNVTVTGESNAATVYMGFTEGNIITNNVFEKNKVTVGTSKRVSGGLMVGYATVITGNAFIDNEVIGANAKGNDVCASVYYTDIDLSGNYWGGEAPVENDNYFVEYPSYNSVIINDYLTTYGE